MCATCTSGTVTGLTTGAWNYAIVYAHNPLRWGAPGFSEMDGGRRSDCPAEHEGDPRQRGGDHHLVGPASNSGSPITGYIVLAYDANGYAGSYATCSATCTSATVTGLTNGRPYTMVVHAGNAVGWGMAALSPVVTPVA